ncbi:MAG: helix-turn-helix domain-containing protein [Sciscionella sp.]
MASASPTVLKRFVALELRRLRETAEVRREAVAERLGCVVSNVTHVENMRNLPKLAEVEVMLGMYGVPERIEAFRALVTAARKNKDWWAEEFAGATPEWFDLLLGMERMAAQIESYDAMCVPGLFQTPEYAKALIHTGEPELPDEEMHRQIDLRMARQDVLVRQPDPPTVWAVLDESVLLRPVGGEKVMREQVEHLLKLVDIPTVTIQVLPLSVGMHPGMDGTFTVLTFPPEMVSDPGVAYTQSRVSAAYYEDPAQIMRYRNTLTRLQVEALTPDKSLAHLTAYLKGAS